METHRQLIDLEDLELPKMSEQHWDEVKGYVRPGFHGNQETYRAAVKEGVRDAFEMLDKRLENGEAISGRDVAERVNKFIYQRVHESAGQLRGKEDVLEQASKQDEIKLNLEDVELTLKRRSENPNITLKEKAELLAYEHVCLHRIQPFKHGNELTARVMLAAQMVQTFGHQHPDVKQDKQARLVIDEKAYQVAVTEAVNNFFAKEKYDKALDNAISNYSPNLMTKLILDTNRGYEKALIREQENIQSQQLDEQTGPKIDREQVREQFEEQERNR